MIKSPPMQTELKGVRQYPQRAPFFLTFNTILLLYLTILTVGLLPKDTSAITLSGSKPNIILIVTDDQTFESINKMPFLSSRKEWVRFTNAFIENPLCCPSRATILTGLHDTHTGVLRLYGKQGGEALDESQTLAVWLKSAGYKTGFIGKYLNRYPWDRGYYVPQGWDEWFAFTKDSNSRYFNFVINHNGKKKAFNNDQYSTEVFAQQAKRFIRNAEEPFFLYMAPYAPHTPSHPSPQDKGSYKNKSVEHVANFNENDVSDKPQYIKNLPKVKKTEQETARRKQWETLLAVDNAIEGIVNELRNKNILNNTVIIFMTDNGYAHGEHRWIGKKCPYDVCMRTPLVMHYPNQEGRKIYALVSNIDIAPTILDLAGASANIKLDGLSLVPLVEKRNSSWRNAVLGHWGGGGKVEGYNPPNYWTVRTKEYRYTEYATGEKELYVYDEDPYELQNRSGDPRYASIQYSLAEKLTVLRNRALTPLSTPFGTARLANDNHDTASIADEDED